MVKGVDLLARQNAAATRALCQSSSFGTEQVGQTYANGILLPTNQWIKPIGTRLLIPWPWPLPARMTL